MKKAALAFAVMSFVSAATPASAASYIFDVIYDGSTASLAAGSDDPLSTSLLAGDDFTYILRADAGNGWTTVASASVFPLIALGVDESDSRTVDYSLNFNRLGSSVFNQSGTGDVNSFVHLGTNTVSFPGGLQFDEFNLFATIVSASTTSSPYSLLPIFGAPEKQSEAITFGALAAVPEPASWAMMIGGFGMIGAAMRRRNVRTTVSFA